VIGPYAVILGPVHLGSRNWIGPHVVIGTPAEISGIDHGTTTDSVGRGIVIGSGNVFREYTTIHQGHYAVTRLGDNAYIMNKVYIGHDSVIGDSVIMASSATLGGHVHVGRGANLGMGAIVHQRRLIGPGTMIGMGSVVTRDVPPFALAYGNPCRVEGVNRVGMERTSVSAEIIDALAQAYAEGRAPKRAEATAAAWDWWEAERDSAASPAASSVLPACETAPAENMRV
jgi:UDP-N-acetylglucosamine acyltransferase